MCMSTVTWQAESVKKAKSPTKWLKGYKFFTGRKTYNWDTKEEAIDMKYYFPFYNLNDSNGGEVPLDTVLKAQTTRKRYSGKIEAIMIRARKDNVSAVTAEYLSGFHIFPSKMASHLYIQNGYSKFLFEVEYRKVTAEGTHSIHTDYPADCVIAQEMRVLRKLTDQEVKELHKIKADVDEIKRRATKRDKAKKNGGSK